MRTIEPITALCIIFSVDSLFADNLGIAGKGIANALDKVGLEMFVGILVPLLGAMLYRIIQIMLQRLPTRWRWANNKLTLGIVNRLLSWLFGKTTMLYNAKLSGKNVKTQNALDGWSVVDHYEKASKALKKEAVKHLARKGGILKAYEKAIEELDYAHYPGKNMEE